MGSFEQHGSRLPLITDTVAACAISPSGGRDIRRPTPAAGHHRVLQ
ncbi:creatininase family protein [Actinocatenispora thailandica]|nr:creatininase family protein [Actinocatenispora thailandica]